MLKFDGKKLRKLRQQRKLTQKQLGLLIGKTTADISNYENGYARPTLETYFTLTSFFDIPPNAFFSAASKKEEATI